MIAPTQPASLSILHDGKPTADVLRIVERLRRLPGAVHVAVLPDAHVGGEACVGVAVATEGAIYPPAVGTDIGCGMASVPLTGSAPPTDRETLSHILGRLQLAVPGHRHRERQTPPFDPDALSSPRLTTLAKRDAAVQFATLGRGNHFLELQADGAGQLWLTVHTGSRALGAAVACAAPRALPADSPAGRAYLSDHNLCRAYADASRRAILTAAGAVVTAELGLRPDFTRLVSCDHNHVSLETHFGRDVFVHRKGVVPADDGRPGIIAGSMGTATHLTVGLGNPEALRSSSHGAGRRYTRAEARRRISPADLRRELGDVVFDSRSTPDLIEEAPSAYRDLRRVLASQRDLTRSVLTLRPLLVHKAT